MGLYKTLPDGIDSVDVIVAGGTPSSSNHPHP